MIKAIASAGVRLRLPHRVTPYIFSLYMATIMAFLMSWLLRWQSLVQARII
ncbi:hypothetical protein [Pantoea sp. RIT413]|uniref:hypothetical protein n=1 Tax=Pantoea sp. RIT413 TaxID=2202162 RepID=UPI001F47BA04|nr:hypothetical protein [Pantoea sp. RIT 413]